jgi:hypothetical protein
MRNHRWVSELSWWFAPHPEWEPGENWPQEVLCVRLETDEGTVLIDPLDAPHDLRPPVRVLLTAPWHARGTVDVAASSVWARPGARWRAADPTTTDELPAGVEALLPPGDRNQALFLIREHRTLVTGDVFSGTGGRFHVFLDDEGIDRALLLPWLEALGDLPIDRVLIAHGDPVLADGAARIRAAVAETRRG